MGKVTLSAMRLQSRPSVDSRSLIENWETNGRSPLEKLSWTVQPRWCGELTVFALHMRGVVCSQHEQLRLSFQVLWVSLEASNESAVVTKWTSLTRMVFSKAQKPLPTGRIFMERRILSTFLLTPHSWNVELFVFTSVSNSVADRSPEGLEAPVTWIQPAMSRCGSSSSCSAAL